jgi:hypothetical protein
MLALASLTLAGCACQPLDQPNTETGGVESTGTVQAELPTATPEATSSVTPTTPATPAEPEVPAIWPAKAATFAKNFKKPAWYPAYLPKGYKLDTIDIIEMGTKTGLVLDIVYLSGDKALLFTQGSPTDRSYDIVSAGKVPWGTDKADIMYQDPEDTSSPAMIIYSKNGTFIELQGDPSLVELKKIAASMVPVK